MVEVPTTWSHFRYFVALVSSDDYLGYVWTQVEDEGVQTRTEAD